ncbi:MAG: hypothetical protein ACLRSW_06590 [Christensenellaceae bacterium]
MKREKRWSPPSRRKKGGGRHRYLRGAGFGAAALLIGAAGLHTTALQALICIATGAFCNLCGRALSTAPPRRININISAL